MSKLLKLMEREPNVPNDWDMNDFPDGSPAMIAEWYENNSCGDYVVVIADCDGYGICLGVKDDKLGCISYECNVLLPDCNKELTIAYVKGLLKPIRKALSICKNVRELKKWLETTYEFEFIEV